MKFTQKDLLNTMGLKVGDKVVVDYVEPILKIEVIELNYYPCLSWSNGNVTDISKLIGLDYSVITPPKYTLTETEKHIVLAIDEKLKWLARDESGLLCAFIERPMKREDKVWANVSNYVSLGAFNQHFQFTQWSDTEPVSLDELREIAKKLTHKKH